MNSANAKSVTVKAKWTSLDPYNFDYTGGEQTWTVPLAGYYKLEVWGAQGGYASYNVTKLGGYGGYAIGVANLQINSKLYINIGGKGGSTSATDSGGSADDYTGYNGGGVGSIRPGNSTHGGGGGSTHIATKTGVLSSLSGSKASVLIVAGGGGGASQHMDYTSGNWSGIGGHGGGYIGGNGTRSSNNNTGYGYGTGGTQSQVGGQAIKSGHCKIAPDAGGFGLGENYHSLTNNANLCAESAGGGGGWYGGGAAWHGPGGGGSGYIGSSSLISSSTITKHMTCYSCTTSTAIATRTNSNTNVSATATADYSKTDNGYARITYLGTSI